ncbi:uncharacterized protein K460DRAFT_398191 [Cucurbitaria berberidis CBS 394.84]|uniref:Uncharacterized protein n=1 Tax=Cucurbitaria berberidis CBS 394.84 TaxID=1168544 RepID=A0A9P4L4M8_9PLEO|nr:uncharacterized protein K460DRAFT_398191 [Cucurbitaria berberidis CBS 394.84]KAF1842121.1 hypothetical protein K460DRAFT_398191 [Cucurbitaria berberidis CBS 394.84]
MPRGVRRNWTIADRLELLGLQTCDKKRQDHSLATRRPVFRYEPVITLYYTELSSLSSLLLREEVTNLDRFDPHLFDNELGKLLETYGPLIWPETGEGNRLHLLMPQEGTLYESDLVYPRDTAVLKRHMRAIVLCKEAGTDTNVEGLMAKTQRDSELNAHNEASSAQVTPHKRQAHDTLPELSRHRRKMRIEQRSDEENTGELSSEDSTPGTKTRHQTRMKSKRSPEAQFKIELRLYRRTKQPIPPRLGPVWPCGTLFLTTEWNSSDHCFSQVCEQIETDCSFMVFQLPEDMSREGQVRLDRGSRDSEATFERILGIFRKAGKFPGKPQHRSVEVEVGLELPMED